MQNVCKWKQKVVEFSKVLKAVPFALPEWKLKATISKTQCDRLVV